MWCSPSHDNIGIQWERNRFASGAAVGTVDEVVPGLTPGIGWWRGRAGSESERVKGWEDQAGNNKIQAQPGALLDRVMDTVRLSGRY